MPSPDTSILVVDDTKFSSAMVNRVIARAGYQNVRHAHSAAAALQMLEERPTRILIAHGECAQSGARQIIADALRWM